MIEGFPYREKALTHGASTLLEPHISAPTATTLVFVIHGSIIYRFFSLNVSTSKNCKKVDNIFWLKIVRLKKTSAAAESYHLSLSYHPYYCLCIARMDPHSGYEGKYTTTQTLYYCTCDLEIEMVKSFSPFEKYEKISKNIQLAILNKFKKLFDMYMIQNLFHFSHFKLFYH